MWKYLVICLLCLGSRQLYAAPDTSGMLHLNIQNGMPSNRAYAVMQDKNGYWWICTDNGLVKYNGYNFRVFTTSDGLPANDIFGCFEDSRQRLWLQCHSYRLGYLKDNIYRRVQPISTRSIIIMTKYYEYDNHVYFTYIDSTNKIVRIDTNGKIKVFIDPLPVLITYKNEYIRQYGSQLQKCIIENDSVRTVPLCRKLSGYNIALNGSRQFLNNHVFTYRFMNSHFNIMDLRNCSGKQYELGHFDSTENGKLYLALTNSNKLMIFSEHYLYLLDTTFRLTKKLHITEIIPRRVQVSNYFVDSAGHPWYSTVTDGVWMQAGVNHIFRQSNLLKDIAGNTFAGTIKNGMSFWWNNDTKTMTVLSREFKTMWRQAFTEDLKFAADAGDSLIYLCFSNSETNSLSLYSLKTKQLRNVADEKKYIVIQELNPNDVTIYTEADRGIKLGGFFNIQQYQRDTLFGSTRSSNISIITKDSDRILARVIAADRFPYFYNDVANNRYWYYNGEKIVCVAPDTRRVTTADRSVLPMLGISNIRQIIADQYSNVFIITGNKLVIYNPKHGRLLYVPVNFNLAGAFMQVYNNKLIVGGKFGIAVATLYGPLALSKFGIVPNFKGHYYNQMNSFVVNAGGNIIASTDMGVYNFTMRDLLSDATLIKTERNPFMRLVVSYPEQHALHASDTFYLPQAADKINFELSNIYGLGNPQYQYQIGSKQGWQESQTGEVYLGDADPGEYYRVECIAHDDVWKSNPYSFYIYRKPYWYQTRMWQGIFWVSGTLFFVVLLLGVILLTRNIVARSNEKKRQLTELELRAIYSQINPHFIFNTLGTALFFINKKNMEEAYQHVSKFSRLLRSYLKSSRNRYITLADEIEMIRYYIELQQIRFENKFSYRIDVENKIPVDSVQIPSLLLQPLVENAITHGLFHLPKDHEGLLVLRFYQGSSSNEIICTIEDNGVGREKAREIKKDSLVQYESYGTALTRELIDIFRQYENMNILLEYIDKTPPDSGTIVKLTIKNLKYVA